MRLAELQLLAAAALIFVPLERLLPLHRGNTTIRPGLRVDVLHVFVSGFLIRAGVMATTIGLSWACAAIVPDGLRGAIQHQPSWMQFIQLFLLSDAGFYLAHRLVHAVPWLWRFHAVHHSSEQMDWLSTFRVHPVDQILNTTIIAVPAVALNFSPAVLLTFGLLYRAHSMLLHSNVRVTFGPLGRFVASPRYHHWHHADEAHAYNRNFGGQLVIWDVLCRTLYEPETLPERYGVGGAMPAGYAQQLLAPLRRERQTRAVADLNDESPVNACEGVTNPNGASAHFRAAGGVEHLRPSRL